MPERVARERAPGTHRSRAARAVRDTAVEQGPTRPDDLGVDQLLRMQRIIGNQAVQRAIQRRDGAAGPATIQRYLFAKTVKIGEEKVIVKNKEEKAEAEGILKRIKEDYGVEASSQTTVEGIKDQYTNVKKKVKDKLRTRAWRMIELRALERALKVYAPILGAERANSTRAGEDQEVTSVGKVKQAIDTNKPAGKLDTTTLGEYFRDKKNMGLFKASENYKVDFPDEGDQLTGTFIHEIAHGLLAYAIDDYIKATGYWEDKYTKLAKDKREETPVTSYGQTSAAEDICESAMMYFIKPSRLETNCPKRFAFMEKLGKDWVPPPAQAPQVKPGGDDVPKPAEVTGGGATGGEAEDMDEILGFLAGLFDEEPETATVGSGA